MPSTSMKKATRLCCSKFVTRCGHPSKGWSSSLWLKYQEGDSITSYTMGSLVRQWVAYTLVATEQILILTTLLTVSEEAGNSRFNPGLSFPAANASCNWKKYIHQCPYSIVYTIKYLEFTSNYEIYLFIRITAVSLWKRLV